MHIVCTCFVLAEVVIGYFAIRAMVDYQVTKFHLQQFTDMERIQDPSLAYAYQNYAYVPENRYTQWCIVGVATSWLLSIENICSVITMMHSLSAWFMWPVFAARYHVGHIIVAHADQSQLSCLVILGATFWLHDSERMYSVTK